MLERIKEQIETICIVLGNDRKTSHLLPTRQDFDVIDSVLVVLSPLEQLTDLLSSNKRVTCSAITPLEHIFDNILFDKKKIAFDSENESYNEAEFTKLLL
uniref:Uncharacterized protein n=1 Tax=Amphimedon queenslandica TaxID=400682 RepID=A0A1X7USY6_AMPQE